MPFHLEALHDAAIVLSLAGFLVTMLLYLALSVIDRTANPLRVLALGLSGLALRREFDRFFLLFQGGVILLLITMLFKYVIEIHILYDIFEFLTAGVFILALSLFLLRYLERRQKVLQNKV